MNSDRDGFVPTPFSTDCELEYDEHVLNNIKGMIENAPNKEMKNIWETKYQEFLEILKRKVENA